MPDVIRQAILDWYVFLSSLSAHATARTQVLDQIVRIPLVTALLLGLTGAAAPCQLTTSVGARSRSLPRSADSCWSWLVSTTR